MLNSFSNNQPLYSNTSHLNLLSGSATPNLNPIPIPIPIPEDKQHLPKTKDPLAPPVPSKNFVVDFGANNPVEQPLHHPQQQYHQGADSNSGPFNQVPKRFSQFILDQQNPYMVQRLDHLSMNLISLYSGGTPSYIDQGRSSRRNTANANLTGGSTTPSNKKTSTTTSDSHRNSGGVSNTINNNEINNNNSNNIRDILDSMGSQATIFSTRLNDNSSSHSLSSSNMASGGLRRSKAVKSKNGILYRLKLRLTKLGKRMKRVFKVKRRKTVKPIGPASQKRRNNILRHFKLKKGDDGTLSRNRSKRSNKQAKSKAKSTSLHISAPVQNQDLSLGSDDRALELVPMDSRLKFRAGLQFVNETELPDLPNEDDSIKRKTLSPPAIIPALNPLTTTGKFSTRKPPPPPEAPKHNNLHF